VHCFRPCDYLDDLHVSHAVAAIGSDEKPRNDRVPDRERFGIAHHHSLRRQVDPDYGHTSDVHERHARASRDLHGADSRTGGDENAGRACGIADVLENSLGTGGRTIAPDDRARSDTDHDGIGRSCVRYYRR
jgi:hypothetical protein